MDRKEMQNTRLYLLAFLLVLALAAYLTSVGAYTSLSPLNLLIYLSLWLLPVWLLSGWVHRF